MILFQKLNALPIEMKLLFWTKRRTNRIILINIPPKKDVMIFSEFAFGLIESFIELLRSVIFRSHIIYSLATWRIVTEMKIYEKYIIHEMFSMWHIRNGELLWFLGRFLIFKTVSVSNTCLTSCIPILACTI